uniref:Uncharacterized protein n=1 Tax=Arundo donax TaxID=35708 RepID=A0A0A9G6I6_ARUDO
MMVRRLCSTGAGRGATEPKAKAQAPLFIEEREGSSGSAWPDFAAEDGAFP